MVNKNFWKGKKVFITGHSGFKGSWLSLWLQQMGVEITGFSLEPPTHPSLFALCHLERDMRSNIGDIRNLAALKSALVESQPDIVIHMAAQSLVRESYQHPVDTYEVNVMGTVNILEAIKSVDTVKVFLNVTTDKCYDNQDWVWGYREHEPLGGYDPYSSSKACSELITSAYRNSFFNPENYSIHGLAIASARAGNVIGGGDWAKDRLIPDCMHALLNNEKIILRYPKSTRPWQHVLEPISGYLTLIERLYNEGIKFSGAWNFGPDDEDAKNVEWVVQKLCDQWGNNSKYGVTSESVHYEAGFLKLDCSKAKNDLNWFPKWGIETIIDKIIAWYQAYNNGEDIREITQSQIADYHSI